MDLNRFKECAAAYGAARRRWPGRERALYDRYAASAEGAAILAEAERGDRFLDAYVQAAPQAGLARRIGARARPAWRRYGVPAAAFAASAILGFAVGFAQARGEADDDLLAELLLGPQSVREIEL
jgi:hypothetical protein